MYTALLQSYWPFMQQFMQYTFKYLSSPQPFKITSALNSLWVPRIIEPAQATQNIPSTATPEHPQYPGPCGSCSLV